MEVNTFLQKSYKNITTQDFCDKRHFLGKQKKGTENDPNKNNPRYITQSSVMVFFGNIPEGATTRIAAGRHQARLSLDGDHSHLGYAILLFLVHTTPRLKQNLLAINTFSTLFNDTTVITIT